jgi:hypothetical protein
MVRATPRLLFRLSVVLLLAVGTALVVNIATLTNPVTAGPGSPLAALIEGRPSSTAAADVRASSDDTVARLASAARGGANGAANRSPVREAVLIEEADELPPAGGETMCFDVNGQGTAIPDWVGGLFGALGRRYGPARRLLEEDRWRVLVGWVPGRFMPPQKPGRKANGEIMFAPTKGRDPAYYLKEYNASWSAAFTATRQKYDYVFQISHRNAIAVCIRERLHLFKIYCTPSAAVEPIAIHHCPCRHCHESSSGRTKGTLASRFPSFSARIRSNFSESVLTVPDEKGHVAFSGPCVEALSAPWLVSRDHIPKFPYEGLHQDLDAILRVQADTNRIVFVAFFNKFWIDHLHNFLFSMVRRARLWNVVFATTDREALDLCLTNRLPCFDASAFAEPELDEKGHTVKVSEAMSWIKPRLAVEVLTRGYSFFMSDLDLSWNKFPMTEVLNVRVDIAHQCDTANKFSINSGFYLARANPRTIRFFENIMVFRPDENSDQTSMKLFSRYDHTHGASNTCLHKWSFDMKCNYKVDASVKVVGGIETFEWRPFERDRRKFEWKLLHATCLGGAHAKLLYLRTMNAWFLDELDNITTREYCIVDSSGATFTNPPSVRTIHGSKYTTAIDESFLSKRH